MDLPTVGPLEIVLLILSCFTVIVLRISQLRMAINSVFLISPIVSKKEKIDGCIQLADLRLLTTHDSSQRKRAVVLYQPLSLLQKQD